MPTYDDIAASLARLGIGSPEALATAATTPAGPDNADLTSTSSQAPQDQPTVAAESVEPPPVPPAAPPEAPAPPAGPEVAQDESGFTPVNPEANKAPEAPTVLPGHGPTDEQKTLLAAKGLPWDDAAQTDLEPQQAQAITQNGLALTPAQVAASNESNAVLTAAQKVASKPGAGTTRVVPVKPAAKAPAARPSGPNPISAAEAVGEKGIRENQAAQTAEAKEMSPLSTANTNTMADVVRYHLARTQQVDALQDQTLRAMSRTIQQYQGAHIDPNRYWNSLSGGQRIMAAVTVAVGGGSGAIQNAINRDVASQQANIERTGKSVGMLGDLFDKYRAEGMDSNSSMTAATASLKELQAQQASSIAYKYGGAQAGALADKDVGALRMEAQKTMADVAQKHAETAMSSFELGQKKAQAKYMESLGAPPGVGEANIVHDAQGNVGVAIGADGAKGYNDEAAAPQALQSTVSAIQKLRADGVRANQAALEARSFELQQNLEAMSKAGTLSTRTAELVHKASGDPAQYWGILPSSDIDKRLEGLDQEGKDVESAVEKRHGVKFLRRIAERKL